MTRKRPCRICRRWFTPHPRTGDRQRVCSAPGCQRERHRRACARWRGREAAAEQTHRLRQRIRAYPGGGNGAAVVAEHRVHWDAVRDAVGPQVTVVIEEITKVLGDWVRDAVLGQVAVSAMELPAEIVAAPRDDMVGRALSP